MAAPGFTRRFNAQVRETIFRAARLSWSDPARAVDWLRMGIRQFRAAARRERARLRGLQVPPVLIASVTQRCNLACAGCYARSLRPHESPDPLTAGDYDRIFGEARSLGISIVILAGGEPLLRPDLFEVTARHPQLLFCVFTNGVLADDRFVRTCRKQRHLIPVLSLEGRARETDHRRGPGLFQQVEQAMGRFHAAGLFWGTSFTASRDNWSALRDPALYSPLLRANGRLVFFIEYVPVEPGTTGNTLTAEQRRELFAAVDAFNASLPGLFIALPGNDDVFDGCLSSGRGFLHLNPQGDLEPCPFAPFADVSLRDRSLADALKSGFLETLRAHHDQWTEQQGGCGLWQRRDWVAGLLGASPDRPEDRDPKSIRSPGSASPIPPAEDGISV